MVTRKELATVAIHSLKDCLYLQQRAKLLAGALGFDTVSAGEIALAASELANNLISNQTINGHIVFTRIESEDRLGLELEAIDSGPGIADIKLAMTDGFSSHGSSGGGLGAVVRLMHEFEIQSTNKENEGALGTHIKCRKWLDAIRTHRLNLQTDMQFSSIMQPKPGEQVSGDALFIKHFNGVYLAGIIDGLGHGLKAHHAAEAAITVLNLNYRQTLAELFKNVHKACQGTRGVAMSLCRIDRGKKVFQYAGIGNVSTRIFFTGSKPFQPTNMNGILGLRLHKIHVFDYPWSKGLLIMHSDGLSSRWDKTALQGFEEADSRTVAKHLFERYALNRDDATILTGRQND